MTVRTGTAVVAHGSFRSAEELVAPRPLGAVFSPAEIRHCGVVTGLTRWAGRLAAKRAVIAAAGDPTWGLGDVEVVPAREACHSPARCAQGHPPEVRLHGPAAAFSVADVVAEVSISHIRRTAVAAAVLFTPGEDPMNVAPDHPNPHVDAPDADVVAETLLDVDERLLVTPAAGHFAPAIAGQAADPPTTFVGQGQSVGVVTSLGQAHDVVSNFTGYWMGYLVLPGERVRAGQPVAWLRLT